MMKETADKLKDNKLLIVLFSISLLSIIGFTFAYVAPQVFGGRVSKIDIESDEIDRLNFEVDKDISLKFTQYNMPVGGENLSDKVVASASLRANTSSNAASYNYYVYVNIKNNNYIYTTSDNKPEILMTVTDPTGANVTSIEGLTYNSSLGGFDVTTKAGLINIANQYLIESNSSTSATLQEWEIEFTIINLDSDQSENAGKTLNAEILIQKDAI